LRQAAGGEDGGGWSTVRMPVDVHGAHHREDTVEENKNRVRAYVEENFLFGAEGITEQTSLLDEGYIDSTSVLEIVSFLEESFGIKVADEELVPENFGSLGNMFAYLERKLAA
jgi:acyl carrier protein